MYGLELLLGLLLIGAVVALPVYVLLRLAYLGRAVRELRTDLDHLRKATSKPPEEPTPAARAVPPSPAAPPQPVMPAARATSTPPPVTPLPTVPRPLAVPPPPRVPPPPPIPAAPAGARPDLESVLGANWLSKLGIAAIILAAAFFLKYAFESGWIGPTARIAIGLIASGALLAAGQILLVRERYRAYAQVLASGGIVIFFLSIYAAFNFYHLIGFTEAFAALAIGAVAASALALANSTQAVALICLLGAFLTPVLIRREAIGIMPSGDLLRLYAYLVALNVWSAVLVRARSWSAVNWLSFGATWILFFSAGPLGGPSYFRTELFAAIYLLFACHGGITTARVEVRRGPEWEFSGVALIVLGAVVFCIASIAILSGIDCLGLPAFSLAGIAIACLLAGLAVAYPRLANLEGLGPAVFRYLSGAALVLLVALSVVGSPPVPSARASVAFGFGILIYLVFMTVALHMRQRPGGDAPAATLLAANALTHVVLSFHALAPIRIWGVSAAALWLPIAAWLSLGVFWLAARRRLAQQDFLTVAALVALVLPAFGLGVVTATEYGRPYMTATLVLLAEFLLLSMTWLGLRRATRLPDVRGDLFSAFGNAAIFFALLAGVARLHAYQGLVMLCGYAVALAIYHAVVGALVLTREDDDPLIRLAYLGLALTFVTIALPLQLRASYITVAWAAESAILVWTGLSVREERARWYGLVLLFITLDKALFIDLARAPAHFTFLLNTRMLAGAAAIAACSVSSWLMWRDRERIQRWERAIPGALLLAANVCLLLFVSLDLWEHLGRTLGSDYRGYAQQLALSIFWSAYGFIAITIGIWRRARLVRLSAMALLGVAILKVFLFDLSFLSLPYRILSFLGLGIILMLVSLLYIRFRERLA